MITSDMLYTESMHWMTRHRSYEVHCFHCIVCFIKSCMVRPDMDIIVSKVEYPSSLWSLVLVMWHLCFPLLNCLTSNCLHKLLGVDFLFCINPPCFCSYANIVNDIIRFILYFFAFFSKMKTYGFQIDKTKFIFYFIALLRATTKRLSFPELLCMCLVSVSYIVRHELLKVKLN